MDSLADHPKSKYLFQRKGPVDGLEFGLGEFDAGNVLKVIVFQVVLFDQPRHARSNHGFGVIDAFRREHPLGWSEDSSDWP